MKRDVNPTISLNRSCIYLNSKFKTEFFPESDRIYCTLKRRGRGLILSASKVHKRGLLYFGSSKQNRFQSLEVYRLGDMFEKKKYKIFHLRKEKGVDEFKLEPAK